MIDLPKVERLGILEARPIRKKNGEGSCGKSVGQDIPEGWLEAIWKVLVILVKTALSCLETKRQSQDLDVASVTRRSTIWFLMLTRDLSEVK